MKSLMKKHKRNNSKDTSKNSQLLDSTVNPENNETPKDDPNNPNKIDEAKEIIEVDLINKKLPKELIIRIFSFLDVVSRCRCAQVSKYWNSLALDGSNWQYVDLFEFQKDINTTVIENISKRCNDFLKGLRLENCRSINDEAIKKIAENCNNIEVLNLKQCIKLTNISFIEIGDRLNKIVYLNIESCNINDEGLVSIGKGCTQLRSIDLSYCKNLTFEALKTFVSSTPNLRYFCSKGLLTINDNVLQTMAQNCPSLVHLNINNCINVSDDGITAIANKCQLLKQISVSNCSNLTDVCITALGRNCHNLIVFEASGCVNFSDTGLAALAKGCHNFARVDLEECSRITDTTLQNLASNCSNLRHLNLSRCECITDEGIRLLCESSCVAVNETLKILELDNCPLITDASLEQLHNFHSLAQLEIYDCQLITKSGIKKLQSKLPNAKVHAYFAPSVVTNNQRPNRSNCSCRCCTLL